MKKKIFIVLLIIFIILFAIFIVLKINNFKQEEQKKIQQEEQEEKQEEKEAVEILEKNIAFQVYIDNSIEDLNKIEEQIKEINGIKNVELKSKEQALEEMKEKFGDKSYLLEGYEGENNVFQNSFIIKVKIDSLEDIDNIENIEETLWNIEGITDISSNYTSLINIYKDYGIDGLKEYQELMAIVAEGDSEKLDEYLKENEDAEELMKY